MKTTGEVEDVVTAATGTPADWFVPGISSVSVGATVGELIGLKDDGCTALVLFPGQLGSTAVPARTVVDLYERHVGRHVVLIFDAGDRTTPIVVGVIRSGAGCHTRVPPAEGEADGERLIVRANERLTLRCGEASITLTKEGKVIIQGTFVSTRASGLNRIVGGSVQIN